MTPESLLFSQGFGTRRECRLLVSRGLVRIGSRVVDDPSTPLELEPGDPFQVGPETWPYRPRALVMLHKPVGTECSARPQAHASVLSLLPAPLRSRGLQPVGRLDVDTSGLLLLTDDGALNHRLTSPKHHVRKVYEVGCAAPVSPAMVEQLLAGVELRDTPGQRVRALACEATAGYALRLTLDEGRYHQVKRMVAAAGNRVARLHRSRIGDLVLPDNLPPGAWTWVEPLQLGLPEAARERGR